MSRVSTMSAPNVTFKTRVRLCRGPESLSLGRRHVRRIHTHLFEVSDADTMLNFLKDYVNESGL